MEEYFAMGGYAGFVWPAYAVTAIVLVAVLAGTWQGLKRRRRQLETLQAARGGRRRRARAEETDTARDDTPLSLEQGRDA